MADVSDGTIEYITKEIMARSSHVRGTLEGEVRLERDITYALSRERLALAELRKLYDRWSDQDNDLIKKLRKDLREANKKLKERADA